MKREIPSLLEAEREIRRRIIFKLISKTRYLPNGRYSIDGSYSSRVLVGRAGVEVIVVVVVVAVRE